MLSGIASQQQIESLYNKYSIIGQTIVEDGWKGKGKQNRLPNMPAATYDTFSSLDKAYDHGEPNVIPPTADDHVESNRIPAAHDKVVPTTAANNSSSANISIDETIGSEDLWLFAQKIKDQTSYLLVAESHRKC